MGMVVASRRGRRVAARHGDGGRCATGEKGRCATISWSQGASGKPGAFCFCGPNAGPNGQGALAFLGIGYPPWAEDLRRREATALRFSANAFTERRGAAASASSKCQPLFWEAAFVTFPGRVTSMIFA
jgi:hypothetical protein